jgi:hypothetical protein
MPAPTAFGLDYSARELSPQEIDAYNRANPNQPISFLIRYIGYPTNRKCISHYPGALRAHEESGRRVLLVHQVAYNDFLGGAAAGAAHARLSVADAERQGWRHDTPIFAAYDRFLAGNPAKGITPMNIGQVLDYVHGFRSVLGDLAGLYGFYDVMGPAVRGQWVKWFWQCGAESALVPGVQFYQWNNGRVYPGGLECDLNKSYVDLKVLGGDDMPLSQDDLNAIADTVKWKVLAGEWRFDGRNPIDFLRQNKADDDALLGMTKLLLDRGSFTAKEVAELLAPAVVVGVLAALPKDEAGHLVVEVDEARIAAEVVDAVGRKLGAA